MTLKQLMPLCALNALSLVACGRPRTDIVAVTTEDTGGYEVEARRAEGNLTGHVCVEQPRSSSEVVARIVQQNANHNDASITLDVYSQDHPIARYVWTRAGQREEPLSSSNNPCTPRSPHRSGRP